MDHESESDQEINKFSEKGTNLKSC